MNARYVSIAAGIGILLAVLGWWARTEPPVAPDPAVQRLAAAGAPTQPGAAHTEAARTPEVPAPFRERVRSFLRSAPTLAPESRKTLAGALRSEILERERSGELLPAESAYLQLALLRVTVSDPDQLRERSQALLADYRKRSDAGWARFRETPDPHYRAYRAAEAAVVQQATRGPEPLSQDELRQRLQALREEYYGGQSPPQ